MQSITPTGGYRLFKDYEACHIWGLVDDCHYYTSIANLVLIPRAISGMSDHCQAVIDLLRYESYKRFGILPKGQVIPQKPQGYNSLNGEIEMSHSKLHNKFMRKQWKGRSLFKAKADHPVRNEHR